MMLKVTVLILLMSSVCALQREMFEITFTGNEKSSGDIMVRAGQDLPGMCWACKWAMRKLKKQISSGATQDEVKQKLINVCDEIGFLKTLCKTFVGKYVGTLVEELSTTDNPSTICINVGVCKR